MGLGLGLYNGSSAREVKDGKCLKEVLVPGFGFEAWIAVRVLEVVFDLGLQGNRKAS